MQSLLHSMLPSNSWAQNHSRLLHHKQFLQLTQGGGFNLLNEKSPAPSELCCHERTTKKRALAGTSNCGNST